MSDALDTWREKLEFLQKEEALATGDEKLAIAKKIEEAKSKIAELEAGSEGRLGQTDRTEPRVDISRIIKYAPEKLIGRETETALLDDSWQKVVAHESGRPHVLGFVALGGEGKTSLVAKWLAGKAGQDWPDCDSVFAWSFYSQGSREQVAVSPDRTTSQRDPPTTGN